MTAPVKGAIAQLPNSKIFRGFQFRGIRPEAVETGAVITSPPSVYKGEISNVVKYEVIDPQTQIRISPLSLSFYHEYNHLLVEGTIFHEGKEGIFYRFFELEFLLYKLSDRGEASLWATAKWEFLSGFDELERKLIVVDLERNLIVDGLKLNKSLKFPKITKGFPYFLGIDISLGRGSLVDTGKIDVMFPSNDYLSYLNNIRMPD